MKIDVDDILDNSIEFPTVLAALGENRILKIDREKDGRFEVYEGCDEYFRARLTPERLAQLGHELIELAAVAKAGNNTSTQPA